MRIFEPGQDIPRTTVAKNVVLALGKGANVLTQALVAVMNLDLKAPLSNYEMAKRWTLVTTMRNRPVSER